MITKRYFLCLIFSAIFISIHGYKYDFTENGLYYKILNQTARTVEIQPVPPTGTQSGKEYTTNYDTNSTIEGDIVIPTTIKNSYYTYTITSLSIRAFSKSNITSLSFEEDSQVTTINSTAFSNCNYLESVIIPASVTTIGERSFYPCNSLKSMEIFSNSLNTFPLNCFTNNSYITPIVDIIFHATNPPMPDYDKATDVLKELQERVTIHVPAESYEEYVKAWDGWHIEPLTPIVSDKYEMPDINVVTPGRTKVSLYCNDIPVDVSQFTLSTTDNDVAYASVDGYVYGHNPGETQLICTNDKGTTLATSTINVAEPNHDAVLHVENTYDNTSTRFSIADAGEKSHTFHIIPNDGWTLDTATLNGQPIEIAIENDNQKVTVPALTSESTLKMNYSKSILTTDKSIDNSSNVSTYYSSGRLHVVSTKPLKSISFYSIDGRLIKCVNNNVSHTSVEHIDNQPILITLTDENGITESIKLF